MDELAVRRQSGWLLILAAGVMALDQVGGFLLGLIGVSPRGRPEGESWLAFSQAWVKQSIALGLILLACCAGLAFQKRWDLMRRTGDVAYLLAVVTVAAIGTLLHGYTTLLESTPIFHAGTFVANALRTGILLGLIVVWFVVAGRRLRVLRRTDLTPDS